MIKALVRKGFRFPTHLQRFHFGGGHAPKAYDWRDDHALNPYYESDPRTKNIPIHTNMPSLSSQAPTTTPAPSLTIITLRI